MDVLTDIQIDDIVSAVPPVAAAVEAVATSVREQIQQSLRNDLQGKSLHPADIPVLKQWIENQFHRSVISPGSTVGLTISDAIGAPMTQTTLNTFHKAGSSENSSGGLGAFRDLLQASLNPKFTMATLHFNDDGLTAYQIQQYRNDFVMVSVKDLLKEFDVMNASEPRGPWYDNYRLIERNIPDMGVYCRLYLDVAKMEDANILTSAVAKAISRESDRSMLAVPSPTYLGIVDVYITDLRRSKTFSKATKKKEGANLVTIADHEVIFVEKFVPELGNIIVQGIDGITEMFIPEPIPTWSIVNQVEVVERTFRITFNRILLRTSGITPKKFASLCKLCGMRVIKKYKPDREYVIVSVPDIYPDNLLVNAKEWLEAFIKAAVDGDILAYAQRNADVSKAPEESPLVRASRYYYAETRGSNLKRLLAHELLNPHFTISNNRHEILKTLGIEATRSYIVIEFAKLIQSTGTYINARYITQVADVMTNMGMIIPITSRGAARQYRGALADSSYERPIEIFKRAAIDGRFEPVVATSACIYVGKRGRFGTGLPRVISVGPRNRPKAAYNPTSEVTEFELVQDTPMSSDTRQAFEPAATNIKPDVPVVVRNPVLTIPLWIQDLLSRD